MFVVTYTWCYAWVLLETPSGTDWECFHHSSTAVLSTGFRLDIYISQRNSLMASELQAITVAHSMLLFMKQSKSGWWLLREIFPRKVIFFIWTVFAFFDSHAQSNSLANESIRWEWITYAYGWKKSVSSNSNICTSIIPLNQVILCDCGMEHIPFIRKLQEPPLCKMHMDIRITRHEHHSLCLCGTEVRASSL